MIYPQNFEVKIEFHKIRMLLHEKCNCLLSRQKVDEMRFLINFDRIQHLLMETNEFKTILLMEEDFPFGYFPDETKFLLKARAIGSFLETDELFVLMQTLLNAKAIINFFKNKPENKYPIIEKRCRQIIFHKFILEDLQDILDKNAQIKDSASPRLAEIRKKMSEKISSVSRRIHAIMKQAQNEGWVSADLSISLVNGRSVIPMDSTHKRKIKGLVHSESATGKTSYVEPAEIVELNNEIKELEYEERTEIVKILLAYTEKIKPYIDDLLLIFDFLAEIDFLRAKARYALSINAILPAIVNENILYLSKARHPLLLAALKKEGKDVVPLNINLNEKQRIVLISGPNAGGKSVCLKTVGLLQYMVQCGLLVTVSGSTEFGVFDNIFIDIGDEQSIENDLSTYSSHLINMKYFIKNSNEKTLLLIDEFGSGTEPLIGGAIAEATLEKLNSRKSKGIITTHYSNLKHFALSAEGIVNGAMQYDNIKMEPLFVLETGNPGSSFALEIARKIGLPEDVLQNAIKKVGKEHIEFDKNLRETLRDKQYIENKRNKIHQTEKRLDEILELYSNELAVISKERKEILRKAKADAAELISEVNKKIENTIRDIRNVQAEKEKTKEIRVNFDSFKKELIEVPIPDDEKILRKINKLKEHEQKLLKKESKPENKEKNKDIQIPLEIRAGDFVKLIEQNVIGEVVDVLENTFVVALGNLQTTIRKGLVERISNSEVKKMAKTPPKQNTNVVDNMREKMLTFNHNIDVRGVRGEEALMRIVEYIDEAIMLNINEVRILHGKGHGILRKMIRDYLKTESMVQSFADERIQLGGDGITVVTFRQY